jgi:hypothetical protein
MSLDDARHHIIDKRDHPVAHEMLQKQVEVLQADIQKKRYDSIIHALKEAFDGSSPERTDSTIRPFFEGLLRTYSLPELTIFARQLALTHVSLPTFFKSIRHNLETMPSRVRIPKSGGTLDAISYGDNILLRTEIASGKTDYDAWERALTCVPCAPILKTYTKKREFLFAASQESYAVTTRFCGMAHEDVFNMQTGSSLEIQKFFTELNTLLHRQRMVIIAELLKHGIVHTHPHTHNFTVEFVRKDALESHAAQLQEPLYKKSILNPTVINSMPYKKEHIAFLPSEYVGNPNLYVPVSRIIDFDGSLINESFVQLTSDQKMDWYQKVILLQYGPLLDVHDRKELTTLLRGEDPWQNT